MLAWYATRFPAVEINASFYRMPSAPVLAQWSAQVPAGFTFVLKSDSGYQPYASKDVDTLLEKALVEGDRKARGKLYEQIQDLLYKDIPMIKHGDLFGFDALRERIDGFGVFYTTPRFWNVWIKEKR